ncbi:Protein CBG25762 [Caenorhabditis briggsae]|uniref:Protein CBG25762 n=1 Tax=Caenorhabditis briggsae TaxID=6238 RepID=B6IHT3_CAEBR|nr:Protein CBG25762 [Caenorhabditis briggsae]CAR99463.1 Protein CBG25762 [Caenorhabditis briggsae]
MNPTMQAPPSYSTSSMNHFSNQPQFAAPNTKPITTMTHRSTASVTPGKHALAQKQKTINHQNRQRQVSECSSHYLLSTFIMCLAGKAAIYIPRPHHKLIWTVFPLMLRCDGRLTFQKAKNGKRKSINRTIETRTLSGAGSIACLFLLVIAGFYNENNHISTMSMKRSQRVPCSISRIHFVHCFSLEPMLHKLLL